MKILLLDLNFRAVSSLVYNYTKLGHEVFYIKPGSTALLDWDNTILWPVLLSWAAEDPTQTNFHYHGFDKLGKLPFGEDNFLFLEDFVEPISEKFAAVKFVDIEKENNFFDAVHVLPHFTSGGLKNVETIIEKYCKGAKIINSSFDPGNFRERIPWFPNSCEFLPACYSGLSSKLGIKNSIGFYRHSNEVKILGIDPQANQNKWRNSNIFSSFHHNIFARQGSLENFQRNLAGLLAKMGVKLENFGGNIRGQGADIRYSGENGITGNYITLSPRKVIEQYFLSRGILHIKSDDWAGGVPSACRSTNTPIIVHDNYVKYTKMTSAWGTNGERPHYPIIPVSDPDFITNTVKCILYLLDDSACLHARNKIAENQKKLFSDEYWNSWKHFLDNLE